MLTGLKSQLLTQGQSDQVFLRQPATTITQQPKRQSVGLASLSNQISESESPTSRQRKLPPSTQNGKAVKAGPMNFFYNDPQDPLHTIKTDFDPQPGSLDMVVRNPVNFSQAGMHSAQHMGRKKRINHTGLGGGYLSEAVDVSSVAERKQQRSHTSAANNTLSTTYGIQQQANRGRDRGEKTRGGSLSYANHKYNQSAAGIKRGSTAPNSNVANGQGGGGSGNPVSLSFAMGGGRPHMDTSSTIPAGVRHQNNVSSDMQLNQQAIQYKFKPRAISSTVSKNIANKKAKMQQAKTPIFTSNYLEQQQPKIKNKLQTLMGEGFGKPVVPVHDSEGQVFQQFEQWQRPPSRQKEPNRAQNLDDINPKHSDRQSWKMQAHIHSGLPQGVSANGMRPRIDFFHHRINGSSEFANQYAAMNYNQMRPPSRHKELPQGLELPPQDGEEEIPSLDEDSDSLDEFEIGIQNAQGKSSSKKQPQTQQQMQQPSYESKKIPLNKTFQPFMPLSGPDGLNRDSSEEDDEAQAIESEILFQDNPTLQDFLNLSNGGSRFIKATAEARRGVVTNNNGGGPSTNTTNQQAKGGQRPNQTVNDFYKSKGATPTQANMSEIIADINNPVSTLIKPRSAAGNRVNPNNKNRIRAFVNSQQTNNIGNIVVQPPGTAPATIMVESNNASSTTNGQRTKKYLNNNSFGKGGWPNADPLHEPPVSIDALLQPALGAESQQPSGAKTTFHTHQHSLIGIDHKKQHETISPNKLIGAHDKQRLDDVDISRANVDMGSFLGRQASYAGATKVNAPPMTSSSQMIFGKRPPEARGNRNKILSAGGSSNNFYKSAILNNVTRPGNGTAALDGTTGPSTNIQEFYSPRPVNNLGVGELKTSNSGEKDGMDSRLQHRAGKSTHHIMFTMTGKHDLHGEETALSDDHELSSLIANSNIQNQGGLKSQTLQFQTALGTDFLDLFAREDGDEEDQ